MNKKKSTKITREITGITPSKEKKKSWIDQNAIPFIFFVFAFILYGNTLFYDYTLDDAIVIKDNAFTKKGFDGIGEIFSYDSFTGFFGKQKSLVAGGRYRPLSIASFAVEYQVFGGLNPLISHLINILLYALTAWLIYNVFLMLLKSGKKNEWYFGIPFLTAILFMAHPVHTEVVANIKGRDELFALIFSLVSTALTIRYLEKGKLWLLPVSGVSFFLGLLSKENTVMFLAVIPLAVYFFTEAGLKKIITVMTPLVLSTFLFLMMRYLVLGYLDSPELPKELLNNPFLGATPSQKFGTILYTFGLYLKLLIFPQPLTHDYYPYQIPLIGLTDWRSLITFAIYLGLLIYSLTALSKKRLPAFGILFYLVTLFIVSNILFPVGTFMNERFIYMPSLGFTLILAWFFGDKLRSFIPRRDNYKLVSGIVLVVIVLLYTGKTISRNPAWKDDFTLFTTDVLVSGNSTKCTTAAGGKYLEKAQETADTTLKRQYFEKSVKYLEKSVTIYPANKNGLLLLGNAHAIYKQDYRGAIEQYMKIFAFDPSDALAYQNTIKILNTMNNPAEVDYMLQVCHTLYAINPASGDVNYLMGKILGQYKGNLDSSEVYLLRAVSLSPENPAPYKDLGVLYGIRQQYRKALEMFTKASELDPKDEQVKQNITITNRFIGQGRKK